MLWAAPPLAAIVESMALRLHGPVTGAGMQYVCARRACQALRQPEAWPAHFSTVQAGSCALQASQALLRSCRDKGGQDEAITER